MAHSIERRRILSFTTTPTGMSLFAAAILVHLSDIGTGTIFLEAMNEPELPQYDFPNLPRLNDHTEFNLAGQARLMAAKKGAKYAK
jgi:hypothetical protein